MNTKTERSPATSDGAHNPAEPKYPVVGIGASIGGASALIRLFKNMPSSIGMAFIVVQHLSQSEKSLADQITLYGIPLPIIKVVGKTKLEKDLIYLIPEEKSPRLVGSYVELTDLNVEHGERTAIDEFFRELADAHKERAIAVILSGAGADGSVGIAQIKGQGGVTLAQDPSDADDDSMPLSAISTGNVDFVLPAVEIPQKLMDVWSNASQITIPMPDYGDFDGAREPPLKQDDESAITRILSLLWSYSGHDFKNYKRATVLRRLERRLQVRTVPTLTVYVELLEKDSQERIALLGDMLIGVTSFFRDRPAFDTLERDYMEELFKGRGEDDEIRAWVTPCSTGEEAYSIAMLLAEQAALTATPPTYQVFASDVNDIAIKSARVGIYSSAIVADVTPVRLHNFFLRYNDRYHIREFIRDHVLFAPHNLLQDPPFSRLNFISCRNLLIYLNRDAQDHILKLLHYALKPGGLLFLGSSESAEQAGEYFELLDRESSIYRARESARKDIPLPPVGRPPIPRPPLPPIEKPAAPKITSSADPYHRALIEHGPQSVIVENAFDPLHTAERAGRRSDSREAIQVAVGDCADSASFAQLQAEVKMYKDQLRDATEGAHISTEQLRASTDELAATNVKRQSTAKELDANRKELRSVNEELALVNSELQSRLNEVHRANDDLKNLIDSADIAAIFIDRDMNIKRFTPRAADVFRVRGTDLGRPLFDLNHCLNYQEFSQDLTLTLETGRSFDRKVITNKGRDYIVRIRPYLTAQKINEGILINFIDVTLEETQKKQA